MPDGRVYVYGSRDEPTNVWCSHTYDVLSTSDLINWDVEQFSFATKGIGKQVDYTDQLLYAPDCIYHNGKYYLYYCLTNEKEDEGVAVSSSPYGPFKEGKAIAGIHGIDPSVFIDDDGQAYLFWGQANAKGAKLSKDMLSIEGEVHEKLLTYNEHAFNEGSSVRKRNGIYYYVYAGHQRHGESNCATLNYATATSPLGPYTYRGVIIDNWGSDRNLVNNHGSIAEIDGQWYIFYHRPTHASSSMRKVCMEPIVFNPDGTINYDGDWTMYYGEEGNIHPHFYLPNTQDKVRHHLCFKTEFTDIPKYNQIMCYMNVTFLVMVDVRDAIDPLTGITRHDLIGSIIRDRFNWSNIFGAHCNIVSDKESFTDSNYIIRTIVLEQETTNNITGIRNGKRQVINKQPWTS